MCLEIWNIVLLVKERRKVPNRGIARGSRVTHPLHQRVSLIPKHVVINTTAVADTTAQQLVHRNLKVLASNVP